MPNASFYFHPEKWHEKTPEALRRLGFRDLHLFRSQTLVAGAGFWHGKIMQTLPCCGARIGLPSAALG